MSDVSLEDRILIRELYGRYALGAATQDADSWIETWAENGVWKTPHFETAGRVALREQWHQTWSAFANASAFNEVGGFQPSGDGLLDSVCSVYEIISLADGGTLKMAGVYRDKLVFENGAWRFARREYTLLNQETTAAA